ncbi:MAG: hypothetical protein JSR47_20640, partial [Proteobacteria bacterium]|nr:hypothetical protein [Pseudomonadota bacterium]
MSDTVIRAERVGKKFIIGHKIEKDALFREAMTNSLRRFFSMGKSVLQGSGGI